MARSEGTLFVYITRSPLTWLRNIGLALAPWNVLAGGKIRSDAEEEKRRETGEKGREMDGLAWERTPEERKMCAALEMVAAEVGAKSITAGKHVI